jgi:alpha-1,2-mannosyltransferase
MFHSSVALLPQSFAMCCILRATAHWLNQQWAWSIFWTGASCLLGWPFAVVVGVPLGVDILRTFWGKELLKPLGWAICSALAIIVPTLLVDFYFYHKWFLAVVNIAL